MKKLSVWMQQNMEMLLGLLITGKLLKFTSSSPQPIFCLLDKVNFRLIMSLIVNSYDVLIFFFTKIFITLGSILHISERKL